MTQVWKPGKLDHYWIGVNYEKIMRRVNAGVGWILIAYILIVSLMQRYLGGSKTGFEIPFVIFLTVFGLALMLLGILVLSKIFGHTPRLFGADFWYYLVLSPILLTISYLLYLISAKTP